MDSHDQRMECLRMAYELGGKAEPVVTAAQQLLDFVAGKQTAAEVPAQPAEVAPAAAAPELQEPASETASPAGDAIAACGTVLVMPEGGGLEDAVQSLEPAAAAVEQAAATTEDAPAEAATAEAVTAEAATAEATTPPDGSDAPPSEAQASSGEPARQDTSTPDAAVAAEPEVAAGEQLAVPPAPEKEPVQPKADGPSA